MQEVLDDPPVEVDKSDKWLDLGQTCQGWPVTSAGHFYGIHLYVTFQEDKTEILYCGLSKCAFLNFKIELMLAEDV